MTYEFAKYPDGTLGVFSNIGKNENDEPIHVHISKGNPIVNATNNIKFYC